MGGPGIVSDSNPHGHYENVFFVELHRQILQEYAPGGGYNPEAWRFPKPRWNSTLARRYANLIKASSHQLWWGFKDPRLPFLLDFSVGQITALGHNVRLVFVRRDVDAVADSLRRRDDSASPTDHLAVAQHYDDQMTKVMAEYAHWGARHVHQIQFESLLSDPVSVVQDLRTFLTCNDLVITGDVFEAAVRCVQARNPHK